jgi:hypothetical protein
MSPRILTTAPIVTELPLALEPVEPDPFLLGLALAPQIAPGTRRLSRRGS